MRVVIVGSGPVGMATALLLARQGQRVTLIDRDPGPTPGQGWDRAGVMQFHLPHGFRHQCGDLLLERLPDVLDALVSAGAVAPGPQASAAGLLVRRSMFERAIWEAASRETGIARLTGHADGVEITDGRATGVTVDSGPVAADLVVDATGRAGWISAPFRPLARRADCGVAYAARQYRLRPGAEPGPREGGPAALLSYQQGFIAMVFEHDAGTFSVLFIRRGDDRSLALLRQPAAFEIACRAVPGISEWTDPRRSEPIDIVRVAAGLTNEYRRQPVGVTGLVAVGDALCVTNPLGARGILLGLRSATALADLVRQAPLADLAGRLDEWAARHVLPWFHDHVAWDASLLGLWSGRPVDPDGPIGPEVLLAAIRQRHPEWLPVLGLYLGMIMTPDVLEPLRTEVRALLRTGWQPPPLGELSRDDLAALITRSSADTPVSA